MFIAQILTVPVFSPVAGGVLVWPTMGAVLVWMLIAFVGATLVLLAGALRETKRGRAANKQMADPALAPVARVARRPASGLAWGRVLRRIAAGPAGGALRS